MAGKVGDDGRDRGVEIEQSPLVENHGHGGCGHDFGERSEIEDARSRDLRRGRIVGKTAKRFLGNKLSAKSDGEQAGGEGAGRDGLFQDAESARKPVILRVEIAHEEGKTSVLDWAASGSRVFCELMGL